MTDPRAKGRNSAGRRSADNTARKQRAGDKAGKSQKPDVITIYQVDTDDPADAERILSERFPEWGDLLPAQRRELAEMVLAQQKLNQPVQVKLTRKESGGFNIDPAGPSAVLSVLKLFNTFGANSMEPVNARASELIKYLDSVGACNDGRYNAALAFIESMEPRDQAEAMLLVRYYVTHDAAIRALSQLGSAEFIPHAQTFGNLASKLMARADQQLETLAKIRRDGTQTVKHIHIDNRNGGQVAVAETINTGGKAIGTGEQAHEQGALGAAMLGYDAQGNGLPVTGEPREEALSPARRGAG